MGFLGKLNPFKRKDDFDFDSLVKKEMSPGLKPDPLAPDPLQSSSMHQDPLFPQKTTSTPVAPHLQNVPPPSFTPGQTSSNHSSPQLQGRDLDLINSKLDTIKALLASLDQRLSHIERSTGGEQKGRLW